MGSSAYERKCPHCESVYPIDITAARASRFPATCPVCELPQRDPGSTEKNL